MAQRAGTRRGLWQVLLATAAVLAGIVAAVPANSVTPGEAALAAAPEGATWEETYIETPDGEQLHADIMRPTGYDEDDATPVILVVSPYLGMSTFEEPGPSDRFFDFFEGAEVFDRGYSVVMVSLRGTGGSSGCLDILGPGEQTDVVTAVQWAASQPWSTGKVGMYGKSYDANTGVVGAALQPEGLEAVVAQQIAPDRYRGGYNDRVRLLQSLVWPSVSYGTNGEAGFSLDNDPTYIGNSIGHSADCQAGMAEHYLEDESIEFWRVRDFVEIAEGSTVPTFITAGYLDNATNIGTGPIEFYNALAGEKRLWLGWWDHVRGNDTVGNRLAMGRDGFFEEVMRFFDHHLKGVPLEQAPTHLDPRIAAQSSDGTWREEAAFPPADAETVAAPLLGGTYEDDATNRGSRDSGPGGVGSAGQARYGAGAWTFSPPLPHRVHLAGTPEAAVEVADALPRANLVVNVYDISPEGAATMVTRGTTMLDGPGEVGVSLWPTDWKFEPGHRIGLLVSGANTEAWLHVPTNSTVTVDGGTVDLPALRLRRSADLPGEPAPRLEDYRATSVFGVDPGLFADRTAEDFPIPPPQEDPQR